jgi:hypothetical protein
VFESCGKAEVNVLFKFCLGKSLCKIDMFAFEVVHGCEGVHHANCAPLYDGRE